MWTSATCTVKGLTPKPKAQSRMWARLQVPLASTGGLWASSPLPPPGAGLRQGKDHIGIHGPLPAAEK